MKFINASDQISLAQDKSPTPANLSRKVLTSKRGSAEEITSTLAVIELKAKDNAKNAKDASDQAMSVKDQAV